jgi:endonuclease III
MTNKFNERLKKEVQKKTIPVKKIGRGRPCKIVADKRIEFLVNLILKGHNHSYICAEAMKEFGASYSSVTKLMMKANQFIKENIKIDTEALVLQHVQKYKEIMTDWDKVDGKTQIAAMQAIEKLLKLHNPETQINNNTLNLNLKDLSVRDLKELLKE